MWSKMRCLLDVPTDDASSNEHSADDFADFFSQKINAIRQSTSTAQPPAITTRLSQVNSIIHAEFFISTK
jgi:hypothetical protein